MVLAMGGGRSFNAVATTTLLLVIAASLPSGSVGARFEQTQACFVPGATLHKHQLRTAQGGRQAAVCSVKMGAFPDLVGDFKKGDKVKVVAKDVIFFHVQPKEYPDGYTVPVGLEGEISNIADKDPKSGKEVSPNRPIQVKFTSPKFMAHFEARELEKA